MSGSKPLQEVHDTVVNEAQDATIKKLAAEIQEIVEHIADPAIPNSHQNNKREDLEVKLGQIEGQVRQKLGDAKAETLIREWMAKEAREWTTPGGDGH